VNNNSDEEERKHPPAGSGGMRSAEQVQAQEKSWLSAGVVSVGASSFFSDFGHEIATSILPSFLTAILHASASALGLIEGISDALTGLMKLIGGPLANDERMRGRIASSGYLGTAIATGALGLATTVWQVGVLRALAWLARGLRSPSRDSLLSSLAPESAYGRAFGVERAGDNLGAVAGPLLAAGLVSWVGIKTAMYFSAIPGLFAAISITIAARAVKRNALPIKRTFQLHFSGLRAAGLLRPMVPIAFFEFGNMATTLLILRATQVLHSAGHSATQAASLAIIIYAAHNAVASIVAIFGGRWVDRSGARTVFATGGFVYVLAYVGFALTWHSAAALWLVIAFVLAGLGIGLAETAESAMVAQMLPSHLRGSGFGLLGGVQSFGDFVSTAVVGLLYAAVSPAAGFLYAAAWMLLSTLASAMLRKPRQLAE